MRNAIILLAAIALTGCNRGGFDDYTHKPDPKVVAAEQKRQKALRLATPVAVTKYYSANLASGKQGVTTPEKAARTTKAETPMTGSLPPAAGFLTGAAPRPGGDVRADASGKPSEAENAAIIARIQGERAKAMRADAMKAEMASARTRIAREPKRTVPGRTAPSKAQRDGTDVTLPAGAPSNR